MTETLKLICGWIGAALALFIFIIPITHFIQLIKNKVKLNAIPVLMLICTVISSILWLSYGLYINEHPIYVSSGVGVIVTSIWLIIYWVFFAKLRWIPALIYNLLYLNLVGELFYIIYIIAGEKGNSVVGWIAMGVNIIMIAFPVAKVIQLFKTNNLNLLPIYISVCSLVNNTFWSIFGFTINNLTIIIPNIIAAAFAVFQIIAWLIVKRKIIRQKRKEAAVKAARIETIENLKPNIIVPNNSMRESTSTYKNDYDHNETIPIRVMVYSQP